MPDMLVARYYGPGDMRLERQPRPAPGPGEIVVRMAACGLCGSDAMAWYLRDRAPLVLGHEPVGTVAATGPGVTDLAAGDRVFVHHHVPCGACHHCRRGAPTMCAQFRGTHLDPGGLAEYFRVPAPNVAGDVLRLPDHLPWTAATLIEPLACCVRGQERAGIRPGDTVLVVGLGFTGLAHVRLAALRGASFVAGCDPVAFRRERAGALGAHLVADPRAGDLRALLSGPTGDRGADVVIVCTGSIAAMRAGLAAAARGATILLFAPSAPGEVLPVDTHRLFFSELTMITSYSAGPRETRAALDLLARGDLDAPLLVTHRFPLSAAGAALETTARAGDSVKVVVHAGAAPP